MVGVFTMLGILGLIGGSSLFTWVFRASPEIVQYYIGTLSSLFALILVSLVILALARILSNQEEILERLRERDSARPPRSLNKDLCNRPPLPNIQILHLLVDMPVPAFAY